MQDPIYAGVVESQPSLGKHKESTNSEGETRDTLRKRLVDFLDRWAVITSRVTTWSAGAGEAAAGHTTRHTAHTTHTAHTAHTGTIPTGAVELHHDRVGNRL